MLDTGYWLLGAGLLGDPVKWERVNQKPLNVEPNRIRLEPETENPSEICSFPSEMFSYLKFHPVG